MKTIKYIIILLMILSLDTFATKLTPVSRGAYSSGTKLANYTIYFTGSGSFDQDSQTDGITPQWQWDFDYTGTFSPDVTTSSSTVTRIYTSPKTYTVAVKYMDNDGQWGTVYSFTITINQVKKYYYVKDHLGNIRQTLNENGGIAAAQDYYPYGEVLRGYNQSLVNEKYKFSEKERDVETSFDYFGSRYYDSQLGVWMQPDPMAAKYPGWSSYNYCINNPLTFIDPHGDTVTISHDGEEINYINGELYWKDGTAYNGKALNTGFLSKLFGGKYSGFVGKAYDALKTIESGGPAGAELVGALVNSDEVSFIKSIAKDQDSKYEASTNTVYWNGNDGTILGVNNMPVLTSAYIFLAHELGHNYNDVINNATNYDHVEWLPNGKPMVVDEYEACRWENQIRSEHNITNRGWYYYDGVKKAGKLP